MQPSPPDQCAQGTSISTMPVEAGVPDLDLSRDYEALPQHSSLDLQLCQTGEIDAFPPGPQAAVQAGGTEDILSVSVQVQISTNCQSMEFRKIQALCSVWEHSLARMTELKMNSAVSIQTADTEDLSQGSTTLSDTWHPNTSATNPSSVQLEGATRNRNVRHLLDLTT